MDQNTGFYFCQVNNSDSKIISQDTPCKDVEVKWNITNGFIDAKQVHFFLKNGAVVSFSRDALNKNGSALTVQRVPFKEMWIAGKPNHVTDQSKSSSDSTTIDQNLFLQMELMCLNVPSQMEVCYLHCATTFSKLPKVDLNPY